MREIRLSTRKKNDICVEKRRIREMHFNKFIRFVEVFNDNLSQIAIQRIYIDVLWSCTI